MMNLSSLCKLKLSAIILFLSALTTAGLTIFANLENHIPIYIASAISIVSFTTFFLSYRKLNSVVNRVTNVCSDIRQGDFESRIINLDEGSSVGKMIDSINNAIDICDAFVRESQLAMKAASEGKYYRKIRMEGMLGMFAHSVQGINTAIDYLKDKDLADQRSKRQVELTIQNVSKVISAAKEGNLQERIDSAEFEGEYKNLVENMNGLMQIISEPLSEIIVILQSLSEGDLTKTIDNQYQGTFDEIKAAVNTTIEKLKDTVNSIRMSSDEVNSSANEISAASTDLSGRTESQASTLEETAASMEEVTAAVRQNAESAKEADSYSSEARQVAEEGGKVIQDVISAMSEINDSSQKISDIINVIDEIAFQTNLLALNAAVEAARAGEAGKGFAVVAEEVRALAGRSAQASKEIKTLISESVGKVKQGSELVDRSGETLDKVINSFKVVAERITEIANASREQQTGIDEINNAVTQMDQATQQNAAMVEETAASAQTLVDLANGLNEMILFFKIGNNGIANNKHVSSSKSKIKKQISNKKEVAEVEQSVSGIVSSSDGWEEF